MISYVIAILAVLTLPARWLKGEAANLARAPSQFGLVIGVVALVIGMLELFSLLGILLILAGLILSASALRSIPSVGASLAQPGKAPDTFRSTIGVLLLAPGILGLFSALLRFQQKQTDAG